MAFHLPASLFHLDALAAVMVVLVAFIGICVGSFARRYMKGDAQYRSFFVQLTMLIGSVSILVCADHLALLLGAWCLSNLLLVRLMIHKSSWKAAKAAGLLAAQNYAIGSMSIAVAFGLLYGATGETSIQAILNHPATSPLIGLALLLILIGAMTQSAIWPFHKWLISSLNSPTPVSGIMHAGLVNGGGFLLVRFSPLYLKEPYIMTAICLLGVTSALLGTLWKLIQNDVKKMLACSTMGQMGFMFAQCGLGLFALAIAHLFWHGMFKAYLFLASGSAAQEKRFDLAYPPKAKPFIFSLICGAIGSLIFGYASDKSWISGDSTFVLMVIVLIAGTQLALPMLSKPSIKNFFYACGVTMIAALVYGGSTQLITQLLNPMGLMQAQPLNTIHLVCTLALTLAWLSILFIRIPMKTDSQYTSWMLKGYVKALNASQSHPDTITSHRNHYQF